MDAQGFLAQGGGNLTGHFQVRAENHCFAHLALNTHDVVLVLPAAIGYYIFRGDKGKAAMETQFLILFFGIGLRMADKG